GLTTAIQWCYCMDGPTMFAPGIAFCRPYTDAGCKRSSRTCGVSVQHGSCALIPSGLGSCPPWVKIFSNLPMRSNFGALLLSGTIGELGPPTSRAALLGLGESPTVRPFRLA